MWGSILLSSCFAFFGNDSCLAFFGNDLGLKMDWLCIPDWRGQAQLQPVYPRRYQLGGDHRGGKAGRWPRGSHSAADAIYRQDWGCSEGRPPGIQVHCLHEDRRVHMVRQYLLPGFNFGQPAVRIFYFSTPPFEGSYFFGRYKIK